MSLRSKLVGTLLGVFLLYSLGAWVTLDTIYTSAFNRLEHDNAAEQLSRVGKYIEAEGNGVELFVMDWAQWDDLHEYANGENPEFFDDNLSEAYLNDLGMTFAAILDTSGQTFWAEAYSSEGDIEDMTRLFPMGSENDGAFQSLTKKQTNTSGLIETAMGPALVTSAVILPSSGLGEPAGHIVMGKLLDAQRLNTLSRTLLTAIDILPVVSPEPRAELQPAIDSLVSGQENFSLLRHQNGRYALSLLQDVRGEPLGVLRIAIDGEISILGGKTLQATMTTLIVAALVLTLTLWVILKGLLLVPIEHLTFVLRRREQGRRNDENGRYLLSTVQHLADSCKLISRRDDEIGELISAFDDLSLSLRDATTDIWRLAHMDKLTGLANRGYFMHNLSQAIESNDRDATDFAVLFVDLDNFKPVNDRLGHEAGDQLLVQVAERLRSAVGIPSSELGPDEGLHNVVSRFGGDEFVIMLTSDGNSAQFEETASAIVAAIASPFQLQGEPCRIGACVGLAMFPHDADSLDGILSCADAAMYEAKRAGKSCWRRYGYGDEAVPLRKSA